MGDDADGLDGVRELEVALEHAVDGSVYENRGERFSAAQVRTAYRNRRWGDPIAQFIVGAKRKTPKIALKQVGDRLRPLLTSFLGPNTDRLGNGLYSLFGALGRGTTATVAEFSEILVGGAVRLGAARVVELLLGWIRGEPLRSRQCATVEGLVIEEPLILEEGVRLETLPESSTDLSPSMPQFVSATEFLGGVVLSIDCELKPSLYAPEHPNEPSSPEQRGTTVAASNKIPNLSHQSFCESMSLACGEYVDWRLNWTDYGELEAFSWFRTTQASDKPRWSFGRAPFRQKDLERAREIHLLRHVSGAGGRRQDVDRAISRWLRSKSALSDADRLIELRIALEALYCKGARSEMSFRVSTYGAWHLGANFEERRTVRATLRKAYDDASRAIHAGELKHLKQDMQLLSMAHTFCLKGILKRLSESEPPCWDELILGECAGGANRLD